MNRLRMYVGLTTFYLRRRMVLLIGFSAVVVGVSSLIAPRVGFALSVLSATLSLGLLAYDFSKAHRGDRRLLLSPSTPDLGALRPPASYSDGELFSVPGGNAICSVAIDKRLTGESIAIRISREPYEIPAELSYTKALALRWYRRENRLIFNSKLVRLDDDPTPEQIELRAITVRPAYYYSALATNYLQGMTVFDRVTRSFKMTDAELVADAGRNVYDLSASRLANIIGVSTLALTSDGKLVLQMQGRDNVSSPGLLAPSGSGSLDFADITQKPTPHSLQSLLVRGMERELSEETGIPPTQMSSTVLGFSLWLEKGGKPEFFGITQLKISSDDLTYLKVPRSEKALVEIVEVVPFDVDQLSKCDDGELSNCLPANHRNATSVPLILNWLIRFQGVVAV